MNRYFLVLQGWKMSIKTFIAVMGLFCVVFTLPMSVEAEDYRIRASDGNLYTVTFDKDNRAESFLIQKSNGDMLYVVPENNIAVELYSAAVLLSLVETYFSDSQFFDWEAAVNTISEDTLILLTWDEIARKFNAVTLDILVFALKVKSGLVDLSSANQVVQDLLSTVNEVMKSDPYKSLVVSAAALARGYTERITELERELQELARPARQIIPISDIDKGWQNFYELGEFQILTNKLIHQYLKAPDRLERLKRFYLGIVPVVRDIQSLSSTDKYTTDHIKKIRKWNETENNSIRIQALLRRYEQKATFESQLQNAGCFERRPPMTVGSIEDRPLIVGDEPWLVEVVDKFSDPNGDLLTYSVTVSDNIVVGADLILLSKNGVSRPVLEITPIQVGETRVIVKATDPSKFSITQSFTVTVEAVYEVPEPVGTIPPQNLTVGGSSRRLDVSPYFSTEYLNYQVSLQSSGIVAVSRSNSRLTITPKKQGTTSIVVTAWDSLGGEATQTIRVTVQPAPAIIVRPSPSQNFTIPQPSVEGLGEGVAVIVNNLSGGASVAVRKVPTTTNNSPIARRINRNIGTIINGPETGNNYIWWEIRWDDNVSGWSIERDKNGEQLLFRRPPDLKIDRLKVSPSPVAPGKKFDISIRVHNNGPGKSAPTELSVYYSDKRHSSLEELEDDIGNLKMAGTLNVPSISANRSKDLKLNVKAPTVPDRYYYGALLPSNIGETDYQKELKADMLRNNLAWEDDLMVESSPDLVIDSIWIAGDATLNPGDQFTLRTTVRNDGIGRPESSPALDYYRSTDADISTSDSWVGMDSVSRSDLDTGETSSAERITLSAPNEPGVYYYGACVERVDNEQDTTNNCSTAVAIRVRAPETPNRAPIVVDEIPAQTLVIGHAFEPLNVAAHFSDPDDDALTYTAWSVDQGVVKVTIEGTALTLTPVKPGSTQVKVRGTDPDGLAVTTSITVTVNQTNRSPVAIGQIPVQKLKADGSSVQIDVTDHFLDLDNQILTYTAKSNNLEVATVSVAGAVLTIAPHGIGNTRVKVTASDRGLTATQIINVVVAANNAPLAIGSIHSQTLTAGSAATVVNVSDKFSEADGDVLTYTATSNDVSVATVSISGVEVMITPVAVGSATVTVTASDGSSTATQNFTVTVNPTTRQNNAPVALGTIPMQKLTAGGASTTINISSSFSDVDGDILTYTVVSNNTSVARVSVSGAVITLTPVAAGSATVTVTASDGSLTASQTIAIRVKEISVTDVCARTAAVRNGIVGAIRGVDDCAEVTEAHLGSIKRLTIYSSAGINTLKASDFSGLVNVYEFVLESQGLTTLPSGVFSELINVSKIFLKGQRLATFPSGVFSGLNKLTSLSMEENQITTLSAGVFSTFPRSLTYLSLNGNKLTTLPSDVFSHLPKSLTSLSLGYNSLTTLDASLFTELPNLKSLSFLENELTTLPTGVFSDLSNLERLHLSHNNLSTLPAGIFSGLYNLQTLELHDNPGAPFTLTLVLERTDDTDLTAPGPATVKVKLAEGAPFTMSVPLSILGGTLSETAATIARGRTESNAITVTQNGQGATTVTLGAPPSVPFSHDPFRRGSYTGIQTAVGSPLVLFSANQGAPALAARIVPRETALLPNFPNPFNPETWFPYQLSKGSDVTLTIYDMRGVLIRQLTLGYQPAGIYHNRARAVHWDGRNAFGEPVASGVYFYNLTVGEFTATRKMSIRK